jgi:uroporphyrinogen III methyltransferase/synthase
MGAPPRFPCSPLRGVALVGAGPGDPALLTLRAAELLRAADVVAHDELVSDAVLAMVPASAELIVVGRRAGRGATGYRIHPEVLSRARKGQFVVRLKAGDPLVFGRGGEEAEELALAGIPFEIVPGISAALGAAAYASIPLTHREHASQVVLTTAHRKDGGLPPPAVAGGRTLVLYMAAHDLAANLAAIGAAGWPLETPAALVVAATTPDEVTVTGTLATLASSAASVGAPARKPALVWVGDVVRLQRTMDWRRALPLRGRRVVVARSRTGPSRVALELRTLGATVMELPHMERVDLAREAPVPPARWPRHPDLIVLPAATAASALYAGAPERWRSVPAIAIGARTLAAARSAGVIETWQARESTIEALVQRAVETLLPARGGRGLSALDASLEEVSP